jgi:transposase
MSTARLKAMTVPRDLAAERKQLERYARSGLTPSRLRRRSAIVLQVLDGEPIARIARAFGASTSTVTRLREVYKSTGLRALEKDQPRRVPAPLAAEKVRAILHDTLHAKPAGATHWSTRTMAQRHGVSQSAVQRLWHANGLKPHLTRTFKLSRDPNFAEKVIDVVGLYMNPPENALVLSVDEKSQIQALDRSQPGLPMKRGRCGTMTHDYKRNGTTTLFTALDTSRGTVITSCKPRHRAVEFLAFMKDVASSTPRELDLHVIVDNYATHKHASVKEWLAANPRVHFHFIPTSSSWLNLVERWFRDLTEKALKRGVFRSVTELKHAIAEYAKTWNAAAKPYAWKKTPDQIFAKVAKALAVLDSVH